VPHVAPREGVVVAELVPAQAVDVAAARSLGSITVALSWATIFALIQSRANFAN